MLIEKYDTTSTFNLINTLRADGIKVLRNDGNYIDIPEDIVEHTEKMCVQKYHTQAFMYDVIDPETKETATLKILDCGFAEVIE